MQTLSFNPKRLHNYVQHDIISQRIDMNRAQTTLPFLFTEERIQRPNTTIGRMSPLQDKLEELNFKRKKNLSIQTTFQDLSPNSFDPTDSPIVRSQNPLLQSPISRSKNPLLESPLTASTMSPHFLDSKGNFVRRKSCLSTATSSASSIRFSPFN